MLLLLPKMASLSPEQLTGRVRSHVIQVAEPACMLHPDAAAAFLAMRAAAASSAIDLFPSSTFRDFQRQLAIWNDKFNGRRPLLDATSRPVERDSLDDEAAVRTILIWSALPGASRHHWGTEVDVYDRAALRSDQRPALVPQEYAPNGVFERLSDWLQRHAADFGFFLPYDIDRGGVQPEPWHLSYAPISNDAVGELTVDVLKQALAHADLAGAQIVRPLLNDIHQRYIASVAGAGAAALAYVPVRSLSDYSA
jgi:LAS superfamily LD-carboxypeptidase LdcB